MWCPRCQKNVNYYSQEHGTTVAIYCQECQCSLESIEGSKELCCHDSDSNTNKEVELECYKVCGGSFLELKQDCFRRGPLGPDGKRSAFYTKFHLKWRYDCNYEITSANGGQELAVINVQFKKVIVSVHHKVIMPTLHEDMRLSTHDEKLWHEYVDKLKHHEFDHIDLSSDPEILNSLKGQISSIKSIKFGFENMAGISGSQAKDLIALTVNAVGNKYVALLQERYHLFDEMTKNGEADYQKDEIFKKIVVNLPANLSK